MSFESLYLPYVPSLSPVSSSFSLSPSLPLSLFSCLVLECRNLPPMDPNGLADPYVKLCMIGEDGHDIVCLKQKSEMKRKTLEPIFDESFFL